MKQLDGLRILFAEDEEGWRVACRMLLEALNARVTEAGNGEEALRLYHAGEFDCVLTDYTMPGMEGDALAIAIKAVNPDQRVVMCSGYAEPVVPNGQLPWFLDAFVPKPPRNMNDLFQALNPLPASQG